MTPYNFSLLFFSFCTFFISLLILLKRQDQVGIIYFIFSCFVSVWAGAFAIMVSPTVVYEDALLFARILNRVAIWIPVFWLHFNLTYVGLKRNYWRHLKYIYIITALVFLYSLLPGFVDDVIASVDFKYSTKLGPHYHVFTVLYFSVVPYSFYLLIQSIKSTQSKPEKLRLIGFTIATISGFLGGGLTFLIETQVHQYGLLFLPLYPFLMAYLMIRGNLFSEEDLVEASHRDKLAAIGTMASCINHEVKSPLYVIKGSGESYLANLQDGVYLSKEIELDEARKFVTKTIAQTERALEIMKRFTLFAKRNIPVLAEKTQVDLREVYRNVLPLVEHELKEHKIEIQNQLPAGLPKVFADPRHIEEVFFNLIVNAQQAMKEKGGVIEAEAKAQGESVNLIFKDNGPGIDPATLKKIFDPFYTTKELGTGLGLFITKQLVEKNGGKIEVQSSPGQGTSFRITFPLDSFCFNSSAGR